MEFEIPAASIKDRQLRKNSKSFDLSTESLAELHLNSPVINVSRFDSLTDDEWQELRRIVGGRSAGDFVFLDRLAKKIHSGSLSPKKSLKLRNFVFDEKATNIFLAISTLGVAELTFENCQSQAHTHSAAMRSLVTGGKLRKLWVDKCDRILLEEVLMNSCRSSSIDEILIDLSISDLTPENFGLFCSAISSIKPLQSLQIYYSEFLGQMPTFLDSAPKSLTSLSLIGCRLGPETLRALIGWLSYANSLTELRLSKNSVVGYSKLCKELFEKIHEIQLESLDISNCDVTDSCVDEFIAAMQGNEWLKNLNVEENIVINRRSDFWSCLIGMRNLTFVVVRIKCLCDESQAKVAYLRERGVRFY